MKLRRTAQFLECADCQRFGLRRLVAALLIQLGPTRSSFCKQVFNWDTWPRQVAADQSGDRSPHSKELRRIQSSQFLSECIGAGIRPPRRMKPAEENAFTAMIGALPNSPPNSTSSPTSRPGTGMIRTAVVLLFITPIAISSAMIAEIVSAEVEPGTATMSMPTEQTLV